MNEPRPDALLKSALEKIVYFEARSEHLQNDLVGARAEAERFKRELAEAAQREITLRHQLAEIEMTVTRAHREKHELGSRVDALLGERTALLEKLIDGARIREAGGPAAEDGIDLAAFISELRGEVLAKRADEKARLQPGSAPAVTAAQASVARAAGAPGAAGVAVAVVTSEVSAAEAQAVRLRHEGRLEVSEEQVLALSSRGKVGRTEETLFGFSVRELSAPDSAARVRATERLRALGDSAAAPALATALHSERDPPVQVALLNAFSALAQGEGASVAASLLTSPSPDVRIAALKAVLHLDPGRAAPELGAATRDPDPAVRRRASLLALSLRGEDAARLSAESTHDKDPEVRRLTALSLGASGREQARGQLLELLTDPDTRVRRAASQSLSRLLGRDVSHLVDLDDAQRRREIRRLATLPLRRVSPEEVLGKRAPSSRPVAAASLAPASAVSSAGAEESKPAGARVEGSAGPYSLEPLCTDVAAEVRCSIRGRTLTELARTSGRAEREVELACELLAARGQVIRRGLKYFTA